jgi:hypothetical protein
VGTATQSFILATSFFTSRIHHCSMQHVAAPSVIATSKAPLADEQQKQTSIVIETSKHATMPASHT